MSRKQESLESSRPRTTRSTVVVALAAYRDFIERKASSGELLSLHHLQPLAVLPCLAKRSIHLFYDISRPLPSLCVSIEKSTLILHTTVERLEAFRKERKLHRAAATLKQTHMVCTRGHYTLVATTKLPQNAAELLLSIVHIIYYNSPHRYNKHEDGRRLREDTLTNQLNASPHHFSLAFLAKFIWMECGLAGLSLRRTKNNAIELDLAAGSVSKSANLTYRLLTNKPIPESHGPSDNVEVSYHDTEVYDLVSRSMRWGKALHTVSEVQSQTIEIVCIPIVRPNMRAVAGRRAEVSWEALLLYRLAPMEEETLRAALEYVELYTEYVFTKLRLISLRELQKDTSRTTARIAPMGGRTYTEIVAEFRKFLLPHLQRVTETTNAHSATVRLYDYASRSLQLVAENARDDGTYNTDFDARTIVVHGNEYRSVNAFAFHHFEQCPIVHLPRISVAQAKRKTGTKFVVITSEIPEAYRSIGLKSVVVARSDTRSEMCFPLVLGNVAVGTFNIECPFYSGLAGDEGYLEVVKSGIEGFLRSMLLENDVSWNISHVRRYSAVHELLQYVQLGHFSHEQSQLIRKLFPDRETPVHGIDARAIPLQQLEPDIRRWIGERYSPLENVTWYVQLPRFRIIDRRSVPQDYYLICKALICNLLQNTLEEGELEKNSLNVENIRSPVDARPTGLCVYSKVFSLVDQTERDQLGLRPLYRGGTVHIGMYLVGVMTRLLGGAMHVDRAGREASISLRIDLPYPKETTNGNG